MAENLGGQYPRDPDLGEGWLLGNLNLTSLEEVIYWPPVEQVLGAAYYTFIMALGSLGNLFIIYATHAVKHSASDRKTLLIIKYLAVLDFLSSILLYPNFIYLVSVGQYTGLPAGYCMLLGIWEIYFPTTSTFLVLMLVAFKLDVLIHPFHSLSHNRRAVHVAAILVYLAGFIIPTAPLYGLATMIYDPKRQTCTFDFYPDWHRERYKCIFVSTAVFFCCIVPLAAIAALSVGIILKVKRRTKLLASMVRANRPASTQEQNRVGKSIKVKVVLMVVLAYAVTWAAFFFAFVYAFIRRSELPIPRSVVFWAKASLMTNQAVNPLVYIYCNSSIQGYFIKILPRPLALWLFPRHYSGTAHVSGVARTAVSETGPRISTEKVRHRLDSNEGYFVRQMYRTSVGHLEDKGKVVTNHISGMVQAGRQRVSSLSE